MGYSVVGCSAHAWCLRLSLLEQGPQMICNAGTSCTQHTHTAVNSPETTRWESVTLIPHTPFVFRGIPEPRDVESERHSKL